MLDGALRLPTLEATRLRLRPVTASDDAALLAIWGDATVCRYGAHPPLADLAAAAAYRGLIETGFATRTLFQWAIELHASGAVVGTCTLSSVCAAHRRAELGFGLRTDAWGRGYATEAVARLLDAAFGDLGFHRIEADVDPRNDASLGLLERIGFRREGLCRQRYFVNDEWQDGILLGLLATDARRARG